jgi:hypothetical protein
MKNAGLSREGRDEQRLDKQDWDELNYWCIGILLFLFINSTVFFFL